MLCPYDKEVFIWIMKLVIIIFLCDNECVHSDFVYEWNKTKFQLKIGFIKRFQKYDYL